MKERHKAHAGLCARITLEGCGIRVGASFGELTKRHLKNLEKEADRVNFQNPKGSSDRLRAFHFKLQREARL